MYMSARHLVVPRRVMGITLTVIVHVGTAIALS